MEDVICEQCPFYEIGKYLDLELAVKGTKAVVQKDTSENSGLPFDVGRGEINFSQKVCKIVVCCETFKYILVLKLKIAKARCCSTVLFDLFKIILTA